MSDRDVIDRINAVMAGEMRRLGLATRQPRYTYFSFRQWRYCWTTERMDDGKFHAFIYKPLGRGSQSGKARQWKLTKDLGFRRRKTARARAERWYNTAQAREKAYQEECTATAAARL